MSDTPVVDDLEYQKALQRRITRKAVKQKNAAAREAFVQQSTGFVDHAALRESLAKLRSASVPAPQADVAHAPHALGAPAPMAFPANNTNRWVPIGPSVVRRGQADNRPRVSGRIKDLAISADGTRAYAATAKGGVWYSGDGGASWEPLGGWAKEPRTVGGNVSAFATTCLLVSFGPNSASDFVMVGTGELGARQRPANWSGMEGMGVLVANAPTIFMEQVDPWESATGLNVFEGLTIVRMVRVPGGPAAGQDGDQVIAATSGGLFLGTRSSVGGLSRFNWAPLNAPPAPPAPAAAGWPRDPTDLLFVGARLFVCYRSSGVAVSDNNGGAFRWCTMNLSGAAAAGSTITGRMSIAVNDDNNTVYVLGEVSSPAVPNPNLIPHVWQIANPSVAAPASPVANALANAPTNAQLWPGQRDYDQAIMVMTFGPAAGRTDRVYLGGSLMWAVSDWNASIWSFDVAGANLVVSPGISDQPAGTTAGADTPGLIGNAIHPDVHTLRKATNADGTRQVWVGCDGGVYASLRNGQTNTFISRNVGLASIEAGFVACHPSSSHYAMLGCQDNGRQVRVGDIVWEVKNNMEGDGGGVIFHPVQSHYVLGQFVTGAWACDPPARYVRAVVGAATGAAVDPENRASFFYSGISAVTEPAGNRARIALGTNRVWVTRDLGTANPNTWNVLPLTPAGPPPVAPVAQRDPRPGLRGPSTAANQAFGVPAAPALGAVITVKWASATTLLALYQLGIVRYQESALNSGLWTSTVLLSPATAAVAPLVVPAATFFTDIEPVLGTNDFYLTCTGQTTVWTPPVPATPTSAAVAAVPPTRGLDTCFFYDSNAPGFRTTGLGQRLPPVGAASPIDPAYSVVVDPVNNNNVYVGTVTGVWTSTRGAAPPFNHTPWTLFDNGLPESTVQDLKIWTDPAGGAGSPRLLRAALQSRGVWEVDLANAEPVRTYLRAHDFDDRRMFPTPLKNPRRQPTAADMSVLCSPDIKIRPESPVTNTPSFQGTNITNGTLKYQLWTFQTAFRWLFPSVIPDGEWTDQFGDLVERHRRSLGMSGARRIDAALWNSVMAAARDNNGNPGVYRAAWQNALTPNLPAGEIDIMETIVPRRDTNNTWQVYRERSTVDVLLHHRDTRPVAANGAFVVLLWRTSANLNTLINTDCTGIVPYVRGLVGGPAQPVPAGWNVQMTGGSALHRLSVDLAARTPRAVSINMDLSTATFPAGNRVLLLAVAGSSADQFSAVPTGAIDRVDRFVRNWPHAAARVISVWNRPGTQLF